MQFEFEESGDVAVVTVACEALDPANSETFRNFLGSVVEENRDVILGLKLFVAGNMVGEYGLGLLQVAREIADRIQLPIMVHIGFAPPSLPEILSLLGEGDIVTHSFHGHETTVVDEAGKVQPEVLDARERGVLLDIGHGLGSFSFGWGRYRRRPRRRPTS